MGLFSAGSKGHSSGSTSMADKVRTHKTNPKATGAEAENQTHKLAARRTAAGNEIKAQQRRI